MSTRVDSEPVAREEILQRARVVTRTEIAPRAAHHDQTGEFPRQAFDALGRAGLMGLFVPRRYGGLETDVQTFVDVVAIVARACASTAMMFVMHHNQYVMIVDHGTEQQKEFFLPAVARGVSLFASATTEPETGGNANFCVSALRRDGDDFVLSAIKPVVSGAHHANWVIATSRARPDAKGNLLSMLIVPGLREDGKGGEAFGVWDCAGMRATDSSGLRYNDCRVPWWHRIGDEDGAPVRATSMAPIAAIGFSAVWLGIAEAACEVTVQHVRSRTHSYMTAEPAHGPVSVQRGLGDYESVQRQVAEIASSVQAARALLLATARAIDDRKPRIGALPAEALPEIQPMLWTTRLVCGETAVDVCRIGLRVCGVAGMRRGFPLERHMRDALTSQVMAPSEDVTKVMLGKQILGVR